jgi:hypothetical protein
VAPGSSVSAAPVACLQKEKVCSISRLHLLFESWRENNIYQKSAAVMNNFFDVATQTLALIV